MAFGTSFVQTIKTAAVRPEPAWRPEGWPLDTRHKDSEAPRVVRGAGPLPALHPLVSGEWVRDPVGRTCFGLASRGHPTSTAPAAAGRRPYRVVPSPVSLQPPAGAEVAVAVGPPGSALLCVKQCQV